MPYDYQTIKPLPVITSQCKPPILHFKNCQSKVNVLHSFNIYMTCYKLVSRQQSDILSSLFPCNNQTASEVKWKKCKFLQDYLFSNFLYHPKKNTSFA